MRTSGRFEFVGSATQFSAYCSFIVQPNMYRSTSPPVRHLLSNEKDDVSSRKISSSSIKDRFMNATIDDGSCSCLPISFCLLPKSNASI